MRDCDGQNVTVFENVVISKKKIGLRKVNVVKKLINSSNNFILEIHF
jgi:hypothetical protein